MIIAYLIIYSAVLIWSGINPKDSFTWVLEVAPAIIALIALSLTYSRFKFTSMLYTLMLMHSLILMVGGHYTYAEVPLFDWLQPLLGFERNNFDKLGHFTQGFVPALFFREILLKNNVVQSNAWRNTFIISMCLAFSAIYELIEWLTAISTGENADAFLGTQGYIWDTQSDMAFALLGAIVALLFFSRYHDKQLIKHSAA